VGGMGVAAAGRGAARGLATCVTALLRSTRRGAGSAGFAGVGACDGGADVVGELAVGVGGVVGWTRGAGRGGGRPGRPAVVGGAIAAVAAGLIAGVVVLVMSGGLGGAAGAGSRAGSGVLSAGG